MEQQQAYEMRQFWGLDHTVSRPPVTEKYYAPPDRDWDGGLDNDGLDISQLDSYINDANNDATYFNELSGVEELKNLASVSARDSPSRQPHQHHIHHHNNIHPNSQHPHSNHHLPDSPPDSGSEPPYSPDHPNLSPNQRSQLSDLYSPSHANGTTILPMGGFASMPTATPPIPHVHSANNPQSNLHHQPIQNTLGNSSSLPYPNGQVSLGLSQPPQNISLQPPYAQIIPNGGKGGRTPESVVPPNSSKKRKTADSGGNHSHGVNIKQEPGNHPHTNMVNTPSAPVQQSIPGPGGGLHMHGTMTFPGEDEEYSVDSNSNAFLDPSYQCIRFQSFQQTSWSSICDSSLKELNLVTFRVDADKGFNFSHPDDAFVCQKKNHFQVTNHIQVSGEPYYVKTPEGLLQKVDRFYVHFFGVKTESPSQKIRVEQSQSDRSKKAFHPVPVEMKPDQMTKITVGRLHFSETTSNNMRKKGKPNPDQRYFYLVVSLQAHCGENSYPVAAHSSEKIIVRASNPGQFESDVEYTFQRGTYPESIFHMGRVGINTDRPDEALVIHGNLRITGQLYQPSDLRAKEKIEEVDTKKQLENVQSMRVVKYAYKQNFVRHAGLEGEEIYDTGIIAQELKEVLPDAVRTTGDITLANGEKIDNFLMVNKERIFMENVGAVKELCKVTGNLENRIGELERMNSKITKLKRADSYKSTTSTSTRASSVASQISTVSRGYGQGHHKFSPRVSARFCSNKLLQISTITVVCILALCLMALATIYILDIQERRDPNSTTSFTTTTNGLNYTIITGSRNPTSSFPFNLTTNQLLSSMSFFPTSFKTYSPSVSLTPATVPSSDESSLTSVTFTITTSPAYYQPVQPPVLGKPQHCSLNDANSCQVHCCSLNNVSRGIRPTRPSSITVTRRFRLDGRSSQTPLQVHESDLITNKLSTSDPYIHNFSSTQGQTQRFKNPPSKKSDPGYLRFARITHEKIDNEGILNSKNSKSNISKRSSAPKPINMNHPPTEIGNPVKKIEILELDATINHIYCLNISQEYYLDCANGTASNFSYGIPISKFMAYDNLTLSIEFYTFSDARQFTSCSNCSNCDPPFADQCDDGSIPSSEQRTSDAIVIDDVFQTTLIDIGKLQKVSYKFRIQVSSVDFSDPCLYNNDLLGEKFYEYNFLFYRLCDK